MWVLTSGGSGNGDLGRGGRAQPPEVAMGTSAEEVGSGGLLPLARLVGGTLLPPNLLKYVFS